MAMVIVYDQYEIPTFNLIWKDNTLLQAMQELLLEKLKLLYHIY